VVRYYGLYANAHFSHHLQLTFAAEKPQPYHVLCEIVLTAAEEGGEYE
jgi:hypothetical protein